MPVWVRDKVTERWVRSRSSDWGSEIPAVKMEQANNGKPCERNGYHLFWDPNTNRGIWRPMREG